MRPSPHGGAGGGCCAEPGCGLTRKRTEWVTRDEHRRITGYPSRVEDRCPEHAAEPVFAALLREVHAFADEHWRDLTYYAANGLVDWIGLRANADSAHHRSRPEDQRRYVPLLRAQLRQMRDTIERVTGESPTFDPSKVGPMEQLDLLGGGPL